MADFVHDLEEVLTYESARSGGATGEATAVLSQLPGGTSGRRTMRRRVALGLLYVAIATAVAALAALLINGEDAQREPPDQGDLTSIALNESDAHAYDPAPGDGSERDEAIGFSLDGDPTTAWETERYDTPDFGNIKKGVGVYLDAGRAIVARGMRVVTPKEGWDLKLYVARDRVPDALGGWTLVGSGEMDSAHKTFGLDTAGRPARYYLVWITSLTEGATGGSSAAISEVKLLG
jgi:eukaryotic-like serine/threonine-protein kinase